MFWRAIDAEFRNQRIVLCAGGVVAVLVYANFHLNLWRNPDLRNSFFHLFGSLICLAFASCSASFAFGGHKDETRIPLSTFLLKLTVGALSTMISCVSIFVNLALSVPFGFPNLILDSLYPDFACLQYSVIYVSGSLITFACSVLFSLLLNRQWLSVLVGFAFGTTTLFLTASFWVRQEFFSYLAMNPANSAVFISGVLLLLSAWSVPYCSNRLKASTRLVVGFSVITVVAFCSSVLVFLSLPLSNTFDVHWSVVSRKGTEIISYAFNDFGRQIWMIPTNPSGGNQIVRKNHAFEVVLSPDGNWFAYFSQKGIFGLRSFSVDLRVARMDGTQDSVLLAGFDRRMSDEDERGARGKEFSPDSKYIALLCDTMIYVVDLEGRIRSQAAILSNSFQDLLGWRPDGTEVLILNHRQKCVQAFNVAKRRFRTIYQAHQRLDRYRLEHTGFGIRYVLDDNVLIDLDKGIAQALPDYIKNAFAVVSPDLNALIYYDWGDYSILGKSSSYVRLFHITTGQDELCAEFRGAIHQPIFSPDGSRIGVERQTESRQIQTVVINRNSIVHTFKDWGLIGWRDSKRIVLADDSNVPKRMALGDIDSGQIHQFYP